MKILKKRSVAAVITAAIVVLATLFGVHRSVGSETKKIEAQFYDGVYLAEAGYTQASIAGQLEQRSNAALGLITIAENYPAVSNEADNLRSARGYMLDVSDSIAAQYTANTALQKEYEALWAALIQQDLSDRDREGASDYASTMDSAQGVIQSSSYNSIVAEYIYVTLSRFPVNILKGLSLCDYPEYFGVEG